MCSSDLGFAAQMSFYFLLSIVPIILIISQIVTSLFSRDLEEAVGWLVEYTGRNLPTEVESLLTGGGSGTLSAVFVIVALWASSKAQFSMMRITNFVLTGGKTTGKGYLKDRIRAVKTMGITILTIIFSIVVMIYGEVILNLTFKLLELNISSARIWLVLRWPVAIILYFFMISYNYYMLPSVKVTYKSVIPGSIFSAVGLLVVSGFYATYTVKFARYNVIYGSLATIVAMLIWFYLIAWVLTLGVLFNRVWWETKGERKSL